MSGAPNPSSPRATRNLGSQALAELSLQDLLELSTRMSEAPSLRRQAEAIILTRTATLTVGQLMSLARRAGRGLLVRGAEWCRTPLVARAFLRNQRLAERDVFCLVSSPDVVPEVLDVVAADPTWGGRRALQRALVRNPMTRIATALGVLQRLPESEMTALALDEAIPSIVRMAASRRLSGDAGGAGE